MGGGPAGGGARLTRLGGVRGLPEEAATLADLARRATRLPADARGRAILGIAGCPGAGKSTLAASLVAQLDPEGRWVVRVPMDGFHLSDLALDRLGRRSRKGAIDTFDAYGYLAALRRVRTETDHDVYLPAFERELEQPVAAEIAVKPGVRLVITEGNYLLADEAPWPAIRGEMAEVWFVELDDAVRQERLVARHVRFGKEPEAARRWVAEVDEGNARLIAATAGRADLRIEMARLEADAGSLLVHDDGRS